VSPKHVQAKVFLPPDLVRQLEERARRLRRSKSEIHRAALAAWLSPDGAEHLEAALSRRLDRMSRQIERLERDLMIANEAQALFIRAWLTATPPIAEDGRAASDAKGRERYAGFLEALGRRLASGRRLTAEIMEDQRPEG
jgi:DNA-binding transcriptional MocR family regulator